MNLITNDYTANDTTFENDFQKVLADTLNVDANGNYDAVAAANMQQLAYPGYTVDDLMTIESGFNEMETLYNQATEVIAIGNDLQNVNQYMSNSYTTENKRINKVLNDSVNDVYLSRETFMLTKYNIAFQHFLTHVIMFTIFVAIIVAFLVCLTFYKKVMLSWKIAGICIAAVAMFYLFGVVLFYRQTMIRRKDDWTKFYFSTPDTLNKTCGSG